MIKAMCYQVKERKTVLKGQNKETDSHIYGHLTYEKVGTTDQ